MILWKDFVLDDFIGPYLVCSDEEVTPRTHQEDGNTAAILIQETRQEKAPARMVGSPSLDSNGRLGMDADPAGAFLSEPGRRD